MVSNFNFFYHRDADLRQGAKQARRRVGEGEENEEEGGLNAAHPGRGPAPLGNDSLLESGLGLVRELGAAAPDIGRGLSLLRPRRKRATATSSAGADASTQPHRHVMVKFQGNVR